MRTFDEAVDQLAAEQPDGLFVKAGASLNGALSFNDITWSQLGRAVNYIAHWIETQLGIPAENETMAYMGIGDIRYPIVILAAMKMGYKILLTSPRNSEDGQVALLKSTNCKKFLHTAEFAAQMQAFSLRHSELDAVEIPDLDEIMQHDHTSKPSYSPPRPQGEDVAMILHSSGSTGLPKPIFIRTGALAVCDTITSMPAPPGRKNMHDILYAPTLMIAMMPLFHIMGITAMARAIYHQGPLVLLPPGKPPSADLVMNAIIQTKPSAGAFTPSILEDFCNLPNGLETLSTLDFIIYGGAPLTRSCGDKVTRVTHLQNGLGSTEILNASCYVNQDPADWEYFEFSDEFGIVMEPATEHSSEMVIKQKADRRHQFVFNNFPELSEWRTKDLFEQHPTKPDLWRYVGRLDDLLVFSNGEKTKPVVFEKTIEAHPSVQGALVVGAGKFQAGLIIEPHPDYKGDEKALIDEIWPLVQKANAECPAYAKVWQSMVILASPDKPFKRAAKGSILRKVTYDLYKSEIADLFKEDEPESLGHGPVAIDTLTDFEGIKAVVRTALQTCQTSSDRVYTDNDDIFDGGLDSLSVLRMSKILSAACRVTSTSQVCPPRLIYNNPTIEQISRAIQQTITRDGYSGSKSSPEVISREEKISAMIHKYTKLLPTNSITDMPPLPTSGKHTAILTGSTGSFGTYLLHFLLRSPSFERIYCLNRSTDAESRQLKSLRDQGLDAGNLAEKVEFLTTDFTQAQFGLSSNKYNELQENVNVFFHNAWPVNFNNSLASFESAVVGVRHCIDFSLSAKYRPHVMFSSSIASVANWLAVRDTTVPDTFEDDPCLPLKQGYGESKHVANSILSRATRSGLRSTVFRLGQMGGSLDGAGVWKKAEWLPTLIATSKSLMKIPSSLGGDDAVNWVPMDIAAQSMIELALSRLENSDEKMFDCFNIVNPLIVRWNDLLNPICEFYRKQGCAIEVVGYADWLNTLKQIEPTPESIDQYPGIKLVDIYEDQMGSRELQYSTDYSVSKSKSLANLQAVDGQLVERWLNRWAF